MFFKPRPSIPNWSVLFLGAITLFGSSALALADEPVKPAELTEAQKERLKERDRLGEQSQKLQAEGKLPEAIAAAEAMLAIEREVLGESSEDAIGSLEMLAGLREARDDWPGATAARARILALRAGSLSAGHWRSIDARFALGRAETIARLDPDGRLRFASLRPLETKVNDLYAKGRYAEAIHPARQILDLKRDLLGDRHPDTITCLNNLAALMKAAGDLDAAGPMFERALRLSEEVLGDRHPDTINSLNNMAAILMDRGNLSAARPIFERSSRLYEEVLGERHAATITSLYNLASMLQSWGDLDAALPKFERAHRLYQEELGERHPSTIMCLSSLAMLLTDRGDYDAARPMLERALRRHREVLGERHPLTISSLNNLATMLQARGDLDAARSMYERSLRLRREVMGERHPDTITSLSNLGALLRDQGNLDAALPVFEQSLRLRRELLGERHPHTIASLGNLALLMQERGDLDAAMPLQERSLRLSEEVQGERHHDSIRNLNNLARLLQARGDLDAAGPMFERAIRLCNESLGERHPDTIKTSNNLALLLRDRGDLDAARERAGRTLLASSARLTSLLPTLTGREQLALLRASSESLNISLTLSAHRPTDDTAAFSGLLAVKGLVAQAEAARRLADRPEARDLRSRLAPMRTRLNALTYARVPADRTIDHSRTVQALADEVAALELALARAVDWRPRSPEAVQVAAAIPVGACLIDILRFWQVPELVPGKPRPPSHHRYVAFVVRSGDAPSRVELGPALAIDEAVASWRARLQQGNEADELGRAVARLVWEPLAPHLGDARTVLVSPDGDLAFLPWAALPDGDSGSCLLRRFAFGVVPSARQLVALAEQEPKPASGGLLAVGGVDYGQAEPGEVVMAASRSAAVGRTALSFGTLPGTADEARAVAALHGSTHPEAPAVETPTGAGATKGRLTSAMPGKRFLHLATHGYFAPPEFRNALAPEDDRTGLKSGEGMGRAEVTGFYPGLLSGLVWAGAASPKVNPLSGALDVGAALMTAEEVGGLDLKGCELAVLSACETGLGRTAGGEGVLGLQRAFLQAGARTVVASLWKVDDEATRALMIRFYSNLWQKKLSPLESLRRAQLSILDDPEFGDGGNSRLWAAWTLSGDPGGLPRLEPPPAPEVKR